LVIVFLSIAVEILGLAQFASVLNRLIVWLPNVVIAVVVFVVAVIIADILNRLIRASVNKMGIKYGGFLGAIVRWAIYIFAGLAILLQLGVAPTIIQSIVVGFVGMLALALGLAFGLGGKDAAAKLIEDLKSKISE
jgi:small-conductance mechanosensitive channel